MMKIVRGKMEDLEIIFLLVKKSIEYMNKRGIDQWDDFYPNRDVIKEDIVDRSLYVIKEDDNILGVITLNEKQEKEYQDINWQCTTGKQLVIHRLAIDPNNQRQGLGNQLMGFAEEKAKELHYNSIRLDTYEKNQQAIRFYEARDYIKRGVLNFSHREAPFIAFEKII